MSGESTRMTLQQFQERYPDVYREAVDAGVATERNRIASIAEGWADRSSRLFAECVRDGSSLEVALTRRRDLLLKDVTHAEESLMIREGADEQLREHFQQTPGLRDQFSSVEAYLAHAHHAEGRVR